MVNNLLKLHPNWYVVYAKIASAIAIIRRFINYLWLDILFLVTTRHSESAGRD